MKAIKRTLCVIIALLSILSLLACNKVDTAKLWDNATYTEDTELGEGETTFAVEVKAGDKLVTFTVKTDKPTVGEALVDCELISGEMGQFGLYVKSVNGIVADYDVDQSYWAFYVNGDYATSGVDMTEISRGVVYRLEYTKE